MDLERRLRLRPGRLEPRAEREDAGDGHAREIRDDPLQQLDSGGIGPVQVLQDEEQRVTRRLADEQSLENLQRGVAGIARHQSDALGVPAIDRQEVGEQRRRRRRVKTGPDDGVLYCFQAALGGLPGVEAHHLVQEADRWIKRGARMMCRALEDVLRLRLSGDVLAKRLHEAALADAGLAGDVDNHALPALGVLPRLPKAHQLERAIDHRPVGAPSALAAIQAACGSQHKVHADRA